MSQLLRVIFNPEKTKVGRYAVVGSVVRAFLSPEGK